MARVTDNYSIPLGATSTIILTILIVELFQCQSVSQERGRKGEYRGTRGGDSNHLQLEKKYRLFQFEYRRALPGVASGYLSSTYDIGKLIAYKKHLLGNGDNIPEFVIRFEYFLHSSAQFYNTVHSDIAQAKARRTAAELWLRKSLEIAAELQKVTKATNEVVHSQFLVCFSVFLLEVGIYKANDELLKNRFLAEALRIISRVEMDGVGGFSSGLLLAIKADILFNRNKPGDCTLIASIAKRLRNTNPKYSVGTAVMNTLCSHRHRP